MVHNERRAITSLAIIMACRMLGVFMILPFFSTYAAQLTDSTPLLIGIALGIYGLTQACLQIPLGSLSDKIGRKKVISAGLIVFALGSLVAALSHSIYGIILGRALQGTSAIGSTILAATADLTRDENRSKAMGLMGLIIGISFFIAMILGPIVNKYLPLSGIFWTIFGLTLLALLLLHTIVPNPPQLYTNTEYQTQQISAVLKNRELLRLNLGIFTMHAILTATFIALPILFLHILHLTESDQILLYSGVMILSFLLMLPLIILAEKKRKIRTIFLLSIATLVMCEILFAYFKISLTVMIISMMCFFTAFSLLEAFLPSIVSKIAPIERKGTAMGIYSTAQFFGIFVGGTLGGLIFSHFHVLGLFAFCAVLGAIWLFVASFMQELPYLSTCIFKMDSELLLQQFEKLQAHLKNLQGVAEVAALPNERLIYIKVDPKIISKDQLRKVIDESNLRR